MILRPWVCQCSWESSCLWDPEILVWPSSWDPGILRSWACYRAWNWCLLWGPWGCQLCLKPRYTSTNQEEPETLVRQGSRVFALAVTGLSQLVWNRCCVPLTSDPKILGVLGCLQRGESDTLFLNALHEALLSLEVSPGGGGNQLFNWIFIFLNTFFSCIISVLITICHGHFLLELVYLVTLCFL